MCAVGPQALLVPPSPTLIRLRLNVSCSARRMVAAANCKSRKLRIDKSGACLASHNCKPINGWRAGGIEVYAEMSRPMFLTEESP